MAGSKTTKKPGRVKKGLKTLGALYATSPANVVDIMDLADMAIKLTMKKGGSPKSTKGKSTMYKKKMASGKTVKGSKSDFEKMVKDLGLSKAEIADMLGLTKVDPKTGVRRKKGGTVAKKMPYKKAAPKSKSKSMLEKQMGVVMPKQQTMKRGKRVGSKSSGTITQQQRMAMGKK